MRAYWAFWWRMAVLWVVTRYLERGWRKNPYRDET